jgi:hypothetical protein
MDSENEFKEDYSIVISYVKYGIFFILCLVFFSLILIKVV